MMQRMIMATCALTCACGCALQQKADTPPARVNNIMNNYYPQEPPEKYFAKMLEEREVPKSSGDVLTAVPKRALIREPVYEKRPVVVRPGTQEEIEAILLGKPGPMLRGGTQEEIEAILLGKPPPPK